VESRDLSALNAHDHEKEIAMTTVDYSVRGWCKRRGICVATFYNKQKHGQMPKVIKIGRRTIITTEADEEWRIRMEALAGAKPAGPAGRS
jgi:hypothetical protein